MKNMQDFYKWLSSERDAAALRKRRLAALTRLSRDQINSVAALEPWFFWGEESAIAT
ncbi:MAG: hypothetical protein HND47_03795 [Chloroflexi bacterium]|nr:hypothetical protein [Chloroflexota bacterium]